MDALALRPLEIDVGSSGRRLFMFHALTKKQISGGGGIGGTAATVEVKATRRGGGGGDTAEVNKPKPTA